MRKLSRHFLVCTALSCLVLACGFMAGWKVLGSSTPAHAATPFPASYFSPYQEVSEGTSLQAVSKATGQKYFTLAFILGNGCKAEWDGFVPIGSTSSDLPDLTSDISYLRGQGGDVTVSFGGAAGQELAQTCSSASSLQAQYQAVVNQYSIMHLDFDIEGGEEGDATTYTRRNTALAGLEAANPGLSISFTLPSATNGLESSSLGLLKNAVAQNVTFSLVNLMTMDYGSADSQMGQEAINAANGLFAQLKSIFPAKTTSQLWSMVGITPMIGQNDSAGEIFSLSNASQVLSFAQTNHIGEIAFWEVSRDNGGCAGSTKAADSCSGISQSNDAFIDTFFSFTSGNSGVGATPTPTTTGGGPGSGSYYIQNNFSGLVLDDTNWSTSTGTLIQQWSQVSGQSDQEWTFVSAGSGLYYIQNNFSGLVLDDTNWSTSTGTQIQQWTLVSGQANQEWSLVSAGSGLYYIKNSYSGLVLDDTGWSTSNGTLIQQWTQGSGQANQEWSLLPA